MTTILGHGLSRRSLLALPPYLRTVAYTRSFTASSPRRNAVDSSVEHISTASNALGDTIILDTLHNAGFSWAAAIPLTAIAVRALILHWPATWQRRRDVSMASLGLLQQAYVTREIRARTGPPSPGSLVKMTIGLVRGRWRLNKKLGLSSIPYSGLLNLGVLWYFSEAIRVKCGSGTGLLRQGWESLMNPSFLEKQPDAATSPQGKTVDSVAGLDVAEMTDSTSTVLSNLDPSLQVEGLPWIIDLTSSDPLLLLPAAVSAAIIIPILSAARVPATPAASKQPADANNFDMKEKEDPWFNLNFLQRCHVAFGFLMFFASAQWPAGVVLYVASSITAGAIHRNWLKRTIPTPPMIMRSERPPKRKLISQWSDL